MCPVGTFVEVVPGKHTALVVSAWVTSVDVLWGHAAGRVCRPGVQQRSACSSGFWALWGQPQQMETMLQAVLLTDTSSPRPDSLRAQCQPGLTGCLCCHLKTSSSMLLTWSRNQTRLSHWHAAACGFNNKQWLNYNFKRMFQSAQRRFTLLLTPWLLWLSLAEFPAVKPDKTSASPFPRCH